jgi:hypothetical protein
MKIIFIRFVYLSITIIIIISHVRCNVNGCHVGNKINKNENIKKVFILLQSSLSNNNSIGGQIKQIREEIKQDMLPRFTNDRPKPNVFSEREMINKLIDEAFKDPQELYDILKHNNWENSKFGGMVLVDSYVTTPYYYFVYIIDLNGYVLGTTTTVSAMIDEPLTGHFGTMTLTDSNKIPDKYISETEAIKLLKDKYPILNDSNLQIKAINIESNENNWAWAIKIPESIQVTDINNEKQSGNIFYINPRIFEISWMDDKSEKDKAEFLNSLRIRPRIALIDKDIFDDTVSKQIKSLNKYSSPEEIKKIFPKKIILENMAQQYEK